MQLMERVNSSKMFVRQKMLDEILMSVYKAS